MNEAELRRLFEAHQSAPPTPPPDEVRAWADDLLRLLFPERTGCCHESLEAFQQLWRNCRVRLRELLDALGAAAPGPPEELTAAFFDDLPRMHGLLVEDADAIYAGDPAATDHAEVIRTYPG
ncbi:MAG: serine acetyltransferase, partial [Gemmatimonadetes bacterium]|nr:serine acetyltransferase [Gemmatimonadota bacterium]NIQ60344.1 serine acetyltransferase [Gemmatimonadota bacterium]NIU80565.1 serine acetyltransferase [Gammaproteobacteria bacterium]NIX48882.1 serine acetyltransferase [Gemmatimonadota bacterium]NIY13325.1 serine acetyltransferase [Gemmatimonadota bacterium]